MPGADAVDKLRRSTLSDNPHVVAEPFFGWMGVVGGTDGRA